MREPDVEGILVEFAVPPDPVDEVNWSTLGEYSDWKTESTKSSMFVSIQDLKVITLEFLLNVRVLYAILLK